MTTPAGNGIPETPTGSPEDFPTADLWAIYMAGWARGRAHLPPPTPEQIAQATTILSGREPGRTQTQAGAA
jgi:hypothetical protein